VNSYIFLLAGDIVWTDDGPNIMTAPREHIPRGQGGLTIHLWFKLLCSFFDENVLEYSTNKGNSMASWLRTAKFYTPDPESPIPARVNAAVMGL